MARKLMIILSLLGLCASVVAWVLPTSKPIVIYNSSLPDEAAVHYEDLSEERRLGWASSEPYVHLGESTIMAQYGIPSASTSTRSRTIAYVVLHKGTVHAAIGTETVTTDDNNHHYLEFGRSYLNGNIYRVPLWSVALVCALASGLLTVLPVLRRRKRARRGQCLHCGYDLRGSTERCPECGTEFDADRLILKADL